MTTSRGQVGDTSRSREGIGAAIKQDVQEDIEVICSRVYLLNALKVKRIR